MALFRGVCDLTAQSAFKLGGMMPPDQRDAVNPCGACRGASSPVCESWRKGQAAAVAQQRKAGGAVEKKEEPFPI
ncbi:hypothetical protein M5E88_04895 [Akkermansia muciniphila]|nr:hypothetical protein M5E88_04895 [Akkermansia muciniphila]